MDDFEKQYNDQLLASYKDYSDSQLQSEVEYLENKIEYSDAYDSTPKYRKLIRELKTVMRLRNV